MDSEIEEKLEDFLNRSEVLDELQRLASEGKKSLVVEFDQLVEADIDLAKALLDKPIEFLDKADEILEDITEIPGSHLRVKDLDETVEIRGIRAKDVGKFIQLEGILTRASDVKPEVKIATFKCLRCGEENRVQQTGKNFREPQVCQNPNCSKRGPFRLEAEESEFRDWQSLRIQELPEKLRGGRIPRYTNAIARDDLVDKAVPGNQVMVTGILRAFQESRRNKKRTTFKKVLKVNHISVKEKSVEETELSPEDEEWIEDLKENYRVRNLIVNSIAPSIFGYEKIKEAIALQLVGSPAVNLPDGSRIRGDSHILMTGDPGTAKSQLLKWTNQVAPRGIYTSGKKATGAGLCVAPNTLIQTGEGYYEIEDFVKERLKSPVEVRPGFLKADCDSDSLATLNDSMSMEKASLLAVWEIDSPPDMVSIKTRTGRAVEVTPATRLPINVDGEVKWVRASEIKAGDSLATPRRIEFEGSTPWLFSFLEDEDFTVLGASGPIKEIENKLIDRYGSIRRGGIDLGLPYRKLYHWRNEDGSGNPSMNDLRLFAENLDIPKEELYRNLKECLFSQKKGHTVKIPAKPNEEFMEAVGMIAGNGTIYETNFGGKAIRFSSSDDDLLEKFRSWVESLETNYDYSGSSVEDSQEIRLHSKLLAEILYKFGIPISPKSSRVKLPPALLGLKDKLLAAYLRGLFSTSGSVNRRDNDSGSSAVELHATSKELAERVQHALLRFEIISKIEVREGNEKTTFIEGKKGGGGTANRGLYVLTITGPRDLLKFKERIGFASSVKETSLKKLDTKNGGMSNLDTIKGGGSKLKDLRTYLDVPRSVYPLSKSTAEYVERGKRGLTRTTLGGMVDALLKRVESDSWEGKLVRIKPALKRRIKDALTSISSPEELSSELGMTEHRYRDYFQRATKENGQACKIPFRVLSRTADLLMKKGSEKIAGEIKDRIRRLEARKEDITEELLSLRNIANSDVFWDEIEEVVVEDAKHDKVYDVTVDNHNLLANSAFVHNTAAAVRDEMTGGWTLEAGALAIGDGGMACIDEFDKMSDEESGAILESMEQQTISVAKAGIVATLNTRTAILAAANPRLGRFDRYDPIPQQIDLPALILSRFDLIFVLRDIPTEEKDRDLADHMLSLQSEPEKAIRPELNKDELRKLIIYIKKYIHPEFKNEEVKQKLKDFFVLWRRRAGGEAASEEEAVPITARQLEALVRLAKSNARLRLSDEVTPEDAEKAIGIYRASLSQLGIEDESGKPDIDMLMTGHSRTQHEKLQRILEIIDELEEDYEDGAPIRLVKEEARAEGIDNQFVDETIRREKRAGRLYSPSEEMISRATR